MRSSVASSLILAASFSLAACSSSDADKKDTSGETGQSGAKWERIVEGSWTLPPGGEKERDCHKVLLDRDIWVTGIRPVAPFGTHHTLLTLGDEKSDCTTAVANGLLYAAGVGSEGLQLPKGVAIKLPKGKYLNLGLHIYNPKDEEISGTSAMEIQEVDAADVQYESEAVLAGPFDINLPPGQTKTVSGKCSMQADAHIFALFPHMHQLGTHIKTTLNIDGTDDVIHDADYSFNEQLQLPLDPIIDMKKGDSVTTECTYANSSNKTVTFGESSDTEMCFSILFRYPAMGQGFCIDSGAAQTIPGAACAKDGDTGNDKQVGQTCTRGGGECTSNANATLCLNDVIQGAFGNFCTFTCKEDSECGEAAACIGSGDRKACIPNACPVGG